VSRLLEVAVAGDGAAHLAARLWSRVDKGAVDECWEWTGCRSRSGYGMLNVSRVPQRAHRLAFLLHNGFLPEVVRHRCDNPPCVNPRHLRAGDQAMNIRDAIDRGRHVQPPRLPGTANAQAKLTEDEVIEARQRRAAGETFDSLARNYGVHRRTMTQAIKGERWSHV
jgi:hypothetical protein